MTTWLDTGLLRTAANNTRPADEAGLQSAADVACIEVEKLCGPVLATAITDELVRGCSSCETLSLRFRPRTLTAVKLYSSGTALTLADYDAGVSAWCVSCGAAHAEGQTLWRKDGGVLSADLLVSYTTGVASTSVAPTWAIESAKLIAQQWLKLMRVFGPNPNASAEGGTRDLVPMGAAQLMADHLLAPGGFA